MLILHPNLAPEFDGAYVIDYGTQAVVATTETAAPHVRRYSPVLWDVDVG
jgi:hypothetical protein